MTLDYKNDIYFDPRLGEIYARLEGGDFCQFDFENEGGRIRHQFIRRPIPHGDPSLPAIYDLTTPYGYGGPVIMELEKGGKDRLLEGFDKAFSAYCQKESIVSEFIRFHPIARNALDFSDLYQVRLFNRTVGINLADFEDPFQAEFSKSARKSVRQALKTGMSFELEEYPDSLADFQIIYTQTMDRKEADDRYYFDDAYFQAFIDRMPEAVLKCRVVFEGQVIAMGFFLRSADILHTHLSGTRTDYLHLSPAYLLRYGLVQWGKAQGYQLIHSGGGRTGDPEDSLYRFKKRFGQQTEFDFHIGQRIWDPAMYNRLVELTGMEETSFFPAYRAERQSRD